MTGEIISGSTLWGLLFAQATVCIAAGLAVSYLLRRHPAKAHQTLFVALIASVLMPASYLLVWHFELGALAFEPPLAASTDVDLPATAEMSLIDSPPAETDSDPAGLEIPDTRLGIADTQAENAPLPWAAILLVLWAAGSATLVGRVLLQFILGLRLLRESAPLETASAREALEIAKARIGIRESVAIRRSPKIHSPVIWCWSRVPVLLVHKAGQTAWDDCDWAAVFCHELAHLERRDHLSGLFAELLATAIPWHPLTWWARGRLFRLSEEACDDWVLAGGQTAVDYAESLLSLSPQRRMAFLPTVVGKERTMKARIYRIVRDQRSDPNIGRRWASGLCALVVLTIATVALAQRQPAPLQSSEPPSGESEMRQQAPPREPAIAGRRNVLERMLDQLVAQAEETEAVLHQRGDEPGEETEVLRSELRTLRDQISLIERQLRDLQQSPRPVQAQRPSVDLPTRERPAENLDDLQNRQERNQGRLSEIDNPDGEEAQALREELQRTEREIQQVETQLNVRREHERQMQELTAHLRELRAQVAENQRGLEQLGDPDGEEARDRRAAQENARREMIRVEEELQQLERDREAVAAEQQERLRRDVERRGDQLRRQLEEAERALREREEHGQGDSDEARELREAISRMQRQMQAMEDEQRQMPEQRPGRDRGTRANRRPDPMSQPPSDESPYSGRSVRRSRVPAEPSPYGVREGDPYGAVPPAQQPAGPDVQRQVEELRGQVNGLNEQMQQMREMLQQLLERRNEQNAEPQEMKRY